ncbi:hypothetical protein UUR5_B0006 [Ureaplasma urealyticum serovar 5 str. ATCC 27817]|nr:hypothetical protein UUR5_B0006 [Ureaplasma urealyticum serovar 5 str. ATCC 27817]
MICSQIFSTSFKWVFNNSSFLVTISFVFTFWIFDNLQLIDLKH